MMSQVVLDLSMSLDGMVAGTDISPEQPLGKNGERLHDWMFQKPNETNTRMMEETARSTGAVLVGARTYYDAIDTGWDGVNPFPAPAFVIGKEASAPVVEGFTLVTDGLESAVRQAKAVAGDKNVWLMGGARLTQQMLQANLVDELHIHLVPILLGAGLRLFGESGMEAIPLEQVRMIETDRVTHIQYKVVKNV